MAYSKTFITHYPVAHQYEYPKDHESSAVIKKFTIDSGRFYYQQVETNNGITGSAEEFTLENWLEAFAEAAAEEARELFLHETQQSINTQNL